MILIGLSHGKIGQTIFIAYALGHAFHSSLICFIELTYQLFVLIGTGKIITGRSSGREYISRCCTKHTWQVMTPNSYLPERPKWHILAHVGKYNVY